MDFVNGALQNLAATFSFSVDEGTTSSAPESASQPEEASLPLPQEGTKTRMKNEDSKPEQPPDTTSSSTVSRKEQSVLEKRTSTPQTMNSVSPPDFLEGAPFEEILGPSKMAVSQDQSQNSIASSRDTEDAQSAVSSVSCENPGIDGNEQAKNKRFAMWVWVISIGLVLVAIGAFVVLLGFTDEDSSDEPLPTPSPTSFMFSRVSEMVKAHFGLILEDSASPQNRAAEWIAQVDSDWNLAAVLNADDFKQRYALAVFYYATGGDVSWINQGSFLSKDLHECDWSEVAPQGVTSATGVIGVANCTNGRRVSSIDLVANNLTGALPEETGVLSDLVSLYLNGNDIGGSLPGSLFDLVSLEILSARFNRFTGTISTEIGKLSNLLSISFRSTVLTGTIPSEMGDLSNLKALTLSEGSLVGTVPESLLQLTELLFLNLSRNKLNGTLSTSYPSTWRNLVEFSVAFNQLSGALPTDIGSLSFLRSFNVESNKLDGHLPKALVRLESLTELYLGDNMFSGSLPGNWTGVSSSLEVFSVRGNQLSGTLPRSLGFLPTLTICDLSNNQFNGTIPASIGVGGSLAQLILQENQFTGPLPSSFAQLENLEILTLHGNNLVGNLSFLCDGTDIILPQLRVLTADCVDEVSCDCCLACCDEDMFCTMNEQAPG